MSRALLAAALLASLTACTMPRYALVSSTDQHELGIITLGGNLGYLVDPRTETCLLHGGTDGGYAVPVSCAKLKANVPEAARFITWDERKP